MRLQRATVKSLGTRLASLNFQMIAFNRYRFVDSYRLSLFLHALHFVAFDLQTTQPRPQATPNFSMLHAESGELVQTWTLDWNLDCVVDCDWPESCDNHFQLQIASACSDCTQTRHCCLNRPLAVVLNQQTGDCAIADSAIAQSPVYICHMTCAVTMRVFFLPHLLVNTACLHINMVTLIN